MRRETYCVSTPLRSPLWPLAQRSTLDNSWVCSLDASLDRLWSNVFGPEHYNLDKMDFYHLVQERAGIQSLRTNEAWFVECDEPSEDPSMTCFLTPESWVEGASDELIASKYLCMTNPDPVNAPYSMNFEDSY